MNNNPYKTPVDHNQKNKQFSPKVNDVVLHLLSSQRKSILLVNSPQFTLPKQAAW